MTAKMNNQTVHVTFPGSSTLEFVSIQNVPVYEPAERGWIKFVFHNETITTINDRGDVERTCVETGEIVRWYTRPHLQEVINMGAREGVGGYYFEFAPDGSVRSSCKEGTYYWGPIRQEYDPYLTMGVTRDYTSWDDLVEMHRHSVEAEKARWQEVEDEYWSDMRRERSDDPSALIAWRDALKARAVSMEGANRVMNEQCIATAEREIANRCPECRRAGVCMCYT